MTNKTDLSDNDGVAVEGSQWVRMSLLALLLLALVAGAIFFWLNPDTLAKLDILLTDGIENAGPLGWVVIIAMMVLHSFLPLPAEFIAIAAGVTYGLFVGVLLVWIGAMIGAIVAFALARRLGMSFVERRLSKAHLKKLEHWRDHQGVTTLLISRLIPVISFNLVNYAAGLTGVGWWLFLWTTAIGILPMTILSVFIGTSMRDLPLSWMVALSIVGISVVIAIHWWVRRKRA